jgi:hypothetical protein
VSPAETPRSCDDPTVSDSDTVVELDDELDATEVTECEPL